MRNDVVKWGVRVRGIINERELILKLFQFLRVSRHFLRYSIPLSVDPKPPAYIQNNDITLY